MEREAVESSCLDVECLAIGETTARLQQEMRTDSGQKKSERKTSFNLHARDAGLDDIIASFG